MSSPPKRNELIRAEGVHKTYVLPGGGSVPVLCGASMSVYAGDTVAVVGKSGAGKSTLLHVLGTLDRPDRGRVWVTQQDTTAVSRRTCARIRSTVLGFVFQSYQLLPEMDVVENVMLPAMARRGFLVNAGAKRARAVELLKAVGLGDRVGHTPLELSGGEQQRVALARALMNDPDILLADEPTGNLDSGTGGQLLEYLFELTRDRGHALVVVTHDEPVARTCDRVLGLADGVLSPITAEAER